MSIKNVAELRAVLADTIEGVKNDPKRVQQAHEISNAAGKMIGTLKVELEYANLRKEKPDIAFLKK